MPKYENSVIYKLCHYNDLENENIYIGSTTNFRSRKNKHKSDCNNENSKSYNLFVYQFIRDNGGWDEWQMIPIEIYPCNSNNELGIRERYHIELLKSKLNKVIPTRTDKEWVNDNKEKKSEYSKRYYDNNREKIAERDKKHYEANKEIILEKKKEYYEVNKQIKLEKAKNYYENNKEKKIKYQRQYNNANREKIKCDHCGSEIRKDYLKIHQNTKKCKNYIN